MEIEYNGSSIENSVSSHHLHQHHPHHHHQLKMEGGGGGRGGGVINDSGNGNIPSFIEETRFIDNNLIEWSPNLDSGSNQWNQPCLLVTSLPSPNSMFQPCPELASTCSCFSFYQIPPPLAPPPPSTSQSNPGSDLSTIINGSGLSMICDSLSVINESGLIKSELHSSDSELLLKPKPRRGRPPNPSRQSTDIEGQHGCILCQFNCTSLNEFLKHIEIHAGTDQPYVCQLCGKVFKFLLAWRNHICSHLSLRPFECGICTARYITNGELIRHKRYKHGGGKPHKCDICTYECVELAKLMRHQRMHAGLKPFKCPSCQYESYDKSKIRRHYVTHTREKPFKCELCGSRFTQSGSLKTHLTNVHEMNKVEFCCPFCNKLVTPNMGELRNHIKTLHHSTNYPMIVNKSIIDQENDPFNQQRQQQQQQQDVQLQRIQVKQEPVNQEQMQTHQQDYQSPHRQSPSHHSFHHNIATQLVSQQSNSNCSDQLTF